MSSHTLAHLKTEQAWAYVRAARGGLDQGLRVVETLSAEARLELAAVGLFGRNERVPDFSACLERYTVAGMPPTWRGADVERGLGRLGLNDPSEPAHTVQPAAAPVPPPQPPAPAPFVAAQPPPAPVPQAAPAPVQPAAAPVPPPQPPAPAPSVAAQPPGPVQQSAPARIQPAAAPVPPPQPPAPATSVAAQPPPAPVPRAAPAPVQPATAPGGGSAAPAAEGDGWVRPSEREAA